MLIQECVAVAISRPAGLTHRVARSSCSCSPTSRRQPAIALSIASGSSVTNAAAAFAITDARCRPSAEAPAPSAERLPQATSPAAVDHFDVTTVESLLHRFPTQLEGSGLMNEAQPT